jgi:hypothetical protein
MAARSAPKLREVEIKARKEYPRVCARNGTLARVPL